MGIKSLSKYLRDTFPHIFEPAHISEYAFKKVAVDTSLYMCNYKALYGEQGWLSAFVKLVATLRENEVHCVFVYDNGFPPEKEAERKERQEARAKAEERVSNLEYAIEQYKTEGIVDDILLQFQDKKKLSQPRMLTRQPVLNISAIEYAVDKMRKQLFNITPEDYETTRVLFDILQVPYIKAVLEAETTCADLCIRGVVDAVLTEDTDVLAYGCPVFLNKINTSDGTCVRILHQDVLDSFEMSKEEFLDFCIMCGTDYNKNIFRVGPSKAHKLITQHRTIENVKENTTLDISILNHIRTREIFQDYGRCLQKVGYCGCPDFQKLQMFIAKKNLRISVENLRKQFVREITIIDEDEEEIVVEEDEEIVVEEDEESN